GPSVTMPALTSRPLGFRPSPPTIAELYFCIHAYQAVCKACNSSGDGWDRGAVESRKMNRYFGMMVLQTVSHTRAEARPPPSVTTTNKLQSFGHLRVKKKRARSDSHNSFSQCCRCWGLGCICHSVAAWTYRPCQSECSGKTSTRR